MRLSTAFAISALVLFAPVISVAAEDSAPAVPSDLVPEADRATAQDDGNPATDAAATTDARKAELDAVTHDIELTASRQAELKSEIDALDKDRATLNQSLIDTNRQVQKLESDIDAAEARLKGLYASEDKIRAKLAGQRDVLAEVLAALQRMGYHPPPAILVRPQDALASIRSAILLGAVVPDLRVAADALADNLRQLTELRGAREKERDNLRENATALAEGRARVTLLIEDRQNQRQASLDALADEQKRSAVLAGQATSLRDLIARMEAENATAAAAAAAAEKAAEVALTENGGTQAQSLGSADRLTPKVAFPSTKGLLPMPASGTQIKAFGDPDGLGGKAQGISLTTREGAAVSSPCDGWVVYAGPFRSYGQLLIINAGDGYHVLLAGMERTDVQLGQFVLAGEPVAAMASQKLANAGPVAVGITQPVLYIEFRKDGASVDPAPWWAAPNVEKVGG
jgi:murein hydrolase activator